MAQDDSYLLSKFKDKTLTLGDALTVDAITVKTINKRTGEVDRPDSKRDGLKSILTKLGYSMDTPYTVVNTPEFLKKLDSGGTNSPFRSLKTVEIALANLGVVNPLADGSSSFAYNNTFVGSSGKANAMQNTDQLKNNKQPRKSRAFEKIPAGKVAFPSIIAAINNISDPDVKGLIFLNAMIPNRPGEIANLKLDEIDFDRGFIGGDANLQKGDVGFRVTKNRNSVDVPEWLREWLKTERDRTLARNPNAKFLFNPPDGSDSNLVDLARKEIQKPGGLTDLFKSEKTLLGRDIKGLKDLQKIIPSILATELKQKDAAKALLGHTTFEGFANSMADMSDRYYLSPVDTIDESKSKAALKVLHSGYAEVLGLKSLNELPAKAGYSVPTLIEEGSVKYPIIQKGQKDKGFLAPTQNNVMTPVDKEQAALSLKESKAQSQANIAKLGKQEQVDWKQLLELEKENIQTDVDLESERIEADSVKKELRQTNNAEKIEQKKKESVALRKEKIEDAKQKLRDMKTKGIRVFGSGVKSIGPVGIGVTAAVGSVIAPDLFAQTMQKNKIAEMEESNNFGTLFRKGMVATGEGVAGLTNSDYTGREIASGVETAARIVDPGIELAGDFLTSSFLSKDAGEGSDYTKDIKPAASQEEMMRPIQNPQLQAVADDEKIIQEQMNLKKQSEDFRSEAERKKGLSLEDQMKILQQQQPGDNYARQ